MNNLQVLNKVLGNNGVLSYIEEIRGVFNYYNFTTKQRRACEPFLFEPTKENAFKALETTPKAWIFVKNYLSTIEIVVKLHYMIENEELNGTYIRMLVTNQHLRNLLGELRKSFPGSKLEKYVKKYEMEKKLKK